MKRAKPSRRRVPVKFCRPVLEHLEDRVCPSGFTDLAANLAHVTDIQGVINNALKTNTNTPLTKNGGGDLGTLAQAHIVANKFTSAVIADLQTILNDSINNDTDDKMRDAIAGKLNLAPGPMGDVKVSHPNGDAGKVEIELHLHQALTTGTLEPGLDLNLGLPGLPVQIDTKGGVTADVGYDFAFGFGYDAGFFVDANTKIKDFGSNLADHQLVLQATLAPSSDFEADGKVGLLQAKITNNKTDTSKPVPTAPSTGLSASFTIDGLALSGSPHVDFTASANLDLHAAASFGSTTDTPTKAPFQFPGIGADLIINWADIAHGTPDVSFNNVSFQFGSFLSDFVSPILKDIQTFTQPMQPINDVLTAPLPGLSDLSNLIGAGDVTILGIAEAYAATGAAGPGFGKLIQLIGILTDISNGLNSIDTSSRDLMVPLGNFSLDTSNPTVKNGLLNKTVDFSKLGEHGVNLAGDLLGGIQGSDVINGIENVADKLNLNGPARDALKKIGEVLKPDFNLNFPILDDPASVIFPLLLGSEGSDMVSLDAKFDFTGATLEKTYGMFGVGIGAKFQVSASGNIHLGYDTYGIREFFKDLVAPGGSAKPADLLDGFYVSDNSQFKVSASLGIEASVTYTVFSVSVEGGAFTTDPIVIGFHDPDAASDGGRLRLSKLGKDKGRILDVVGKLEAGVQIEVKVGYDPPIGPFIGFTKTFDIAGVTLLDLGKIDTALNANGTTTGHLGANGIPSDNPPIIAGDSSGNPNVGPDGILYLYLGADAGKRKNGPPTDDKDPENWEVSQETDGSLTVKALGVSQNFVGVTKIMAVGAVASQTITIDEGVTVDAVLTGGSADDVLTYLGSGKATLSGGEGNDRLRIGPKSMASELHGGKGDDILVGGGHNDGLYGDDNNDTLFAGDGDQYLDGGAGDDQLVAGKGHDGLHGGDGNDVISWRVGNGAPVAVDGGAADFTPNSKGIISIGNSLEVLGNVVDGRGNNTPVNNNFTASSPGGVLTLLADGVTFTAGKIQQLSLDGQDGADIITVHALTDPDIKEVHVNQNQSIAADGAADVVNVDAGPSTDILIDKAVGKVADAVPAHDSVPAKPAVEGAQALINFRDSPARLSYKVYVANAEAQDSLVVNTGSAGTTVTVDLLHLDLAVPNGTTIPALPGQIIVNDAPNPNVFNIKSTTGPTTINAHGGNNTFNVGSVAPATGGTLDGITSPLTLNGSGGTDELNIDDSGDTTDRTAGMLTGTQVTGLGNATITYSGMSALSIALGKGNDHFTVALTHTGSTSIDAGPGIDTIDLLALYGPTTVHGGDGTDKITLDATSVVGPTNLYGDKDNDQLTVNHLPNGQVANLDGGAGADSDTVNIAGFGGSIVNVIDSGVIGSDTLTVNGTGQADNFLLRAAWAPVAPVPPGVIPPEPVPVPNGVAFVAALHGDPVSSVERVNYTMGANRALPVLKALVLDMKGGDDSATLDDNAADTTVYGGAGNDHFQVGQIFKSPRDALAGVADEDKFTTVLTTRGFLSNGVSYETTINGDDNRDASIPGGNDVFVVFHNTKVLNLNGDAGDDLFTVRAFALEGSTDTNISGGKDVNLIQYVLNAQVNVDGGEGIDTLRIIGTEFADRFLITDKGIFGAGLNVTYKNIENLQVDGAEGDDEFYVLSTGLVDSSSGTPVPIDVTLFGGLGNDLFSIAGDSASLPVGTTTDAMGNTVPIVHDATVESHMVKYIQGSLTVDGAGGKGSAGGLGKPVMLPGETSLLTSDGTVLAYTGTGTSLSIDTMTVDTSALLMALPREFPLPLQPTLADLVGKTLQISTGPGIDRFWQITGVAVGATTTVLTLKSPGVPADEWGLPDNTSGFKVTHLSPNFFVSETDTLDSFTVFNDGSTTNDVGALSATAVTGLGMTATGIAYTNMETVEVLLGTGDDTFTVTGTAAGAMTAVHGGGGGDHLYVNGGGGMNSPLLVYGDTTQDRSRYSSDGKCSTAGFYNADGVTPRPGAAFKFTNDGGDTIDASLDTQTVAIYGGGGNDKIWGSQAGDHLAGGAGDDEIHGQGGADHIYGDSGFNQDLTTRLDRVTPASQVQILQVVTSETAGNDKIFGDGGDDIIFGDHGIITQTDGTQRIFTTGNVIRVETTNFANGGNDEIQGGADNDVSLGGAGNDRIDGNDGQDLILGDHGVLTSRAAGDMTSPRFRTLGGAQLYDSAGNAQVTAAWQTAPGTLPAWANWLITLTDGNAGNDYLAGGAGNDTIFGQAGDDTIQGDGSIRLDVGTLASPQASVEDFDHFDAVTGLPVSVAGNDGDDYVEGGAGSDLVFGNLGQDDLIGGSSSLFGTVTARSDGADTIFGGAGTRIARNDLGDQSAAGHARDADTILGDNGNIFRTLGATGGYLTFNYDNYGPSKIIPRAVVLLDYTPGGNAADLGAADVLHGEGGDDEIHGQTGNDVLFGEGQDDDVYGEAGSDRIYAGAGEDGVLGDDGRIQTSRNGLTETLYGLTTPNAQVNISIPGPFTGTWEYITGRLYKTVTVAAWTTGGNDVIYGGLGDDFLHAGAGDDAVSGAEAQAAFYNALPVSNTNPLGYDPVTRKLAAYDANNPLTRIAGFFLNFDAVDSAGQKIEDGKDRIFGDLGNDWLVGGTGNDRLFGGKGDDMLNADDNLDTAGGLNNQPDSAMFADRDFVYGGDGLDVLIANTGGDRLFDWGGEFNSYVTSFSPFGAVAVSRFISPAIAQFLTDLGRTSGADQSLIDPNSETGLFRQSDPEWNQNLGGPRDPQAGNTQARRDTQGGPEDDRGTALPLAGTMAAAAAPPAAQANTFDVTINNVAVTKDPSVPSQLALFIGGGTGDDVIEVRRGSSTNMLRVLVNSVDKGEFARTGPGGTIGRVIIYGNDGNDTITINADVDPIAAVLYGGAGNDTLRGGTGSNVLDGGTGNDTLTGGAAADILIGGSGLDTLFAAGGDDILIGGIYLPSEDLDAVAALAAEWTSSRSYSQRVANLRSGVGANGAYQVNTTTVIDDGTADSLNRR